MKREHGAAYAKATKTMAAPATVSDETALLFATGRNLVGKVKTRRLNRKPGDLPHRMAGMIQHLQ